jgi:hypothetical protein
VFGDFLCQYAGLEICVSVTTLWRVEPTLPVECTQEIPFLLGQISAPVGLCCHEAKNTMDASHIFQQKYKGRTPRKYMLVIVGVDMMRLSPLSFFHPSPRSYSGTTEPAGGSLMPRPTLRTSGGRGGTTRAWGGAKATGGQDVGRARAQAAQGSQRCGCYSNAMWGEGGGGGCPVYCKEKTT